MHIMRSRWNKKHVLEQRPRRADPVLSISELASISLTSDPREQL
jgi:hypothetical protein